nr:serine-threonine/tyrosine-protein kinase catalytic domain-containing protein [Tanacetum cinerariifolium]
HLLRQQQQESSFKKVISEHLNKEYMQLFGGKDWTLQSGQIQVQCSCNGGAEMSIGSIVPIYKVNSKVTSKSLRTQTRHGSRLWAVGAAKGGVWYYFVAANPSLKQQIRAMISFCILSAPIFEQGSHSRFVVTAIDIVCKSPPSFNSSLHHGELSSSSVVRKIKPPYWFSAHLHCKFSDLVQHGDGSQIIEVESGHGPHEIQYGEEWLTITCRYNFVYPLAKRSDFRTLNLDKKECCDWEMSKLQSRGTKLFEFVCTFPCHNSTQTVANGLFSGRGRSPSGSSSLSSSSSGSSRSRSSSYTSFSSSSLSRSTSSRSPSPTHPKKSFGDGLKRGRSPPPRKSSPIPESLVLHIDQLTRNVNENHLREIFGNFGEVVHVRLAMDPTVNLPRGSGYVEFKTRSDAEKARLHMDGAQIDGKVVQAKFTLPERKKVSPPPKSLATGSRRDVAKNDAEKDGPTRIRDGSPRRKPLSPPRRRSPIARRAPRRGSPPPRRGSPPPRRGSPPYRRDGSPPYRRRPWSPSLRGRLPSPLGRRYNRPSSRRMRGSPVRRRSPPIRRRSPRRGRSPLVRRPIRSSSSSISPRRGRPPVGRRGRLPSLSDSPSPRKVTRKVSRSRSPRRPLRRHGGFGKVYKGTISNGGSRLVVAIKRLDSTSNQGAEEFWAEVEMLSKLRHCHLVSLIDYCNDHNEMILVYEYMPRGTLEDHLHKRLYSLPWITRLKICIGAARGLDYLHTGTGIKHGVIHRDVKSSNILLQNIWEAKISDFGLSKICPKSQQSTYVNTIVKGTFGYLDPNYFYTGKLTRKSDVYAFGVVLFEVLCGKRAVDSSLDEDQWSLAVWAQDSIKEGKLKQIVDSKLRGSISSKCLKEFARIADRCLHSHPKQRPTMAEVVVGLESVLALQEKANSTLQPAGGITIFRRKVPLIVSPSNAENLAQDRSSNKTELYLDSIRGENHTLHRFDFDIINIATEKFSEANKFVDHGYGSIYKGRLRNGQDIAVTLPSSNEYKRYKMHEASILAKLEHENLIKLLGYCIKGTDVFLVSELAHHSSLDSLIFDPMCDLLDWNKRYKIILGVANVLVYLHKDAPIKIIHGHLTSESILLDKSFYPKLSHFGFATEINETDCIPVNLVRGTMGYTAPERLMKFNLSTKADVFNFGVVVLETIIGRKISIYFHPDRPLVECQSALPSPGKTLINDVGAHIRFLLQSNEVYLDELKKVSTGSRITKELAIKGVLIERADVQFGFTMSAQNEFGLKRAAF